VKIRKSSHSRLWSPPSLSPSATAGRPDREYHRYHFHCHTGRLSRSAGGGNATGAGCEPGYSPCLPRVADLNCNDVPASKKPIRVTGSDPYRLDGDGDGWGCEP